MLFSRRQNPESPYAVVIYPKEKDRKFHRNIAQKWVDMIFPESVRGNSRSDLPPISSYWYQRGYINYHVSDIKTNSDFVDHVIIGYRSQSLWNPKDFLLI